MSEEDKDMGAEGRVIRCLHPVLMVGAVFANNGGTESTDTRDRDMYESADVREHDGSWDSDQSRSESRGDTSRGVG